MSVQNISDKSQEDLIQEEVDKLNKRQKEIEDRVADLDLFHEHLVLIHRYEGIELLSFLEMSEQTIGSRRRQSWYGKIVAISQVDSGDDIIEKKKKLFKVGDVVNFNPDSAWSLNIPKFEEIWALHVDNVLCADRDYDYIEYKKENAKKRVEVMALTSRMQFQRAQAEARASEIKDRQSAQKVLHKN